MLVRGQAAEEVKADKGSAMGGDTKGDETPGKARPMTAEGLSWGMPKRPKNYSQKLSSCRIVSVV